MAEPVDEEGGGPVVFNREYASKRPASDHPGPEMAGGKQCSITRAITSGDYRGSASSDEESPKGTVSRWTAETAGVGRWARQQRLIIPKAEIDRLPVVSDNTAEHRVHFGAATQRAVKVTEPGGYGTTYYVDSGKLMNTLASPVDYAKRWELFNQVFADEVEIEGFTEGEGTASDTFSSARIFFLPWNNFRCSHSFLGELTPNRLGPFRLLIK